MKLRFQRRLLPLFLLAGVILGCTESAPPAAVLPTPTAAPGAAGSATAAVPGEIQAGGAWTRVIAADPVSLNPILAADSASTAVTAMLYPTLLGQDPQTGEFTPAGAMAESWTVADDGLTWTFKLRPGVTWSDGDSVDAADFKFTYDALASDLVETVRKDQVAPIASITVIDPLTVAVRFKAVRCDAIANLGLGWLPSHLYAADFSDIMTSLLNEEPAVSAGPFTFQSWTRGDNIVLTRNASYWGGAPYLEDMIFRIAANADDRLALLVSGELDSTALEPTQLTAVQGNAEITVYRAASDGYDFIALNLANPENPQPGREAGGNLLVQEPHPILGDVVVRRAIAHALDYTTIINNIYLGQGYPLAANVLPAVTWAYNDALAPYAYDPNLARQLLDEAGWVDGNNDGIREREGKTLSLTLLTFANNEIRTDLGALVQDQLNAIGFDIELQAIDARSLVDQLLAQTFDMAIVGWTGLGADPHDEELWKAAYDTPRSGFNYVSFQSARVDELLTQGAAAPGCAQSARAPHYKEIQQIIHDQIPYIFLTGVVQNTAYRNNWGNIDPGPWSFYWNVHTWYNKALQP